MNSGRAPDIRVEVDASNPGQFFACCGLLELADRFFGGAEGCFESNQFVISGIQKAPDLTALLAAICDTPLEQLDPEDDYSSPMRLAAPFAITLNWWRELSTKGNQLKVWAGSMRPVRIASAMQSALRDERARTESLFNFSAVVFDPVERDKKVEPFYFDSRRGANAQSRDVGFAPDALDMTTEAYPAVEFFCLVGLQRCRPLRIARARTFEYHTWTVPCAPELLPIAVCGLLSQSEGHKYRFENAFRTDQKKHKSFLPAEIIGGSR